MIIYLNLDEKRESVKKREKGEILFHLDSNSVIIFENLLVWSRLLDVVTGGGRFLGNRSDLKMKRRM